MIKKKKKNLKATSGDPVLFAIHYNNNNKILHFQIAFWVHFY